MMQRVKTAYLRMLCLPMCQDAAKKVYYIIFNFRHVQEELAVSAAKFLLEHFYYGQIIENGRPAGEPQLLAASPGITEKMVEHAVSRVSLPPLLSSPKGSWALVRGKSRQMPFLMAQSQQGRVGQRIEHYIIAQPDMLKAFGGNLEGLQTVVEDELPIFKQTGVELPLLELDRAEPRSVDEQIDDILELMMMTNNRTDLIEPLLAAIVEGTQLVIQAAPSDLDERILFIDGLLALLPASARFGVTFTTHSVPTSKIDVQIRFYSDGYPPDETTIFNWGTKAVFGKDHTNQYSRFIMSQLRLDTELVIRQNTRMTTIAGWRLNQDDPLDVALDYASKRIRLDEALRTGQPINKDDVAEILGSDPTIPDDLRHSYAEHLVSLSIAMQEMESTMPVALLLRDDPELEQKIFEQMQKAMLDNQFWLVYDAMVDWLSHPLGPQNKMWVELAHRALLMGIQRLIDANDIDEINAVLEELQAVASGVAIGEAVPAILQAVAPLSQEDAHIAENIFILAVRFIENKDFVSLMNAERFRDQLAPEIKRIWSYILTEDTNTAPAGALHDFAHGFGEELKLIILTRFSEMALLANHYELVDRATLKDLAKLAFSDRRDEFAKSLHNIVRSMDNTALAALEDPGPFYILQIFLAIGQYRDLARHMLNQSVLLYPGDLQTDYIRMVGRLFSSTPVDEDKIAAATEGIREEGIKSLPYIVAVASMLMNHEGTDEADEVAVDLYEQVLAEEHSMDVMPPDTTLRILSYHCRREDVDATNRAAQLVLIAASYQGAAGVRMMAEMYKLMEWSEATQSNALRMLKVFVREANDQIVHRAISYFGRELGPEIRTTLEISNTMNIFMGETGIEDYARLIHMVASFLYDTCKPYANLQSAPTGETLLRSLESLPGGLGSEDRRILARNALEIGRAFIQLGRQYQKGKRRNEAEYLAALTAGRTNPRSILDIFRMMGGYFSRGKRVETDLTKDIVDNFLQGYTSQSLLDNMITANELFQAAMNAFPLDETVNLTADRLEDDIDSLWTAVDREGQVRIIRDLAVDLQRIADLVGWIEANGDAKAYDDNNNLAKKIDSGKQRPRSALEFYRFIFAYYSRR